MNKIAPEEQNSQGRITRKQFLLSFWWLAAGVLLLQIAGAIRWLLWPKRKEDVLNALNIPAGNIADYKIGDVVRFEDGKFFISKVSGDAVLAMSWRCTHLGCPSFWESDQESYDSIKATGKIACLVTAKSLIGWALGTVVLCRDR